MNKNLQSAGSAPDIMSDSASSQKSIPKELDLILVYYVLKHMSDEDHPLSINMITERLNQLFSDNLGDEKEEFDVRTIRRKMGSLVQAKEAGASELFALLEIIMGGRLEVTDPVGVLSGRNKTSTGKQKRFYFAPVLSDSDFEMISGSIQCSRYLSDDEKEYLLSRLGILGAKKQSGRGTPAPAAVINGLPPRPAVKKNAVLPKEASVFLKNVMILHHAIETGKQVFVQYGTYDISEKMKIGFHAKGEPFVLNPYAMFWSSGQYYLIATGASSPHPYHYRVDRIISARFHSVSDKSGLRSETAREPLPDSLKQFFTRVSKSCMRFDSAKYTAVYPNMRIFDEARLVDCTFECTSWSLQILIDTFGSENITLAPSSIDHSADEVDLYGRPQRFLAATVRRVQYENAQKLCLSNPEYLTLLSPAELVEDVADRLMQCAGRYRSYASLPE